MTSDQTRNLWRITNLESYESGRDYDPVMLRVQPPLGEGWKLGWWREVDRRGNDIQYQFVEVTDDE